MCQIKFGFASKWDAPHRSNIAKKKRFEFTVRVSSTNTNLIYWVYESSSVCVLSFQFFLYASTFFPN